MQQVMQVSFRFSWCRALCIKGRGANRLTGSFGSQCYEIGRFLQLIYIFV